MLQSGSRHQGEFPGFLFPALPMLAADAFCSLEPEWLLREGGALAPAVVQPLNRSVHS